MKILHKCAGFFAEFVAKACPRRGRDSSAADVASEPQGDLVMAPAGEGEIRIPMGQEGSSTPAPATSVSTSCTTNRRIRSGCGRLVIDMALRLHGCLLGKIRDAISAAKLHIITGTCSMLGLNCLQSEDQVKILKRLIEFIKKAIPFESVLMFALCNHPYYYSSNTAFKICLVLVLLAFFTDFLSALLLHLKSLGFLIKYLVYTSSVTQMMMPFFLLVSSGQLQFYMILVVPLPFFSVTLFHKTSMGAGADTEASALDHSFDVSSWIYALSSGGALIGPNTISIKFIAATTLACSLFLTIFIARYLMLISTLRPREVVGHVETLMNILKLLWELTIILFILDRFGWRVCLVATTVTVVDAVLLSMPSWLPACSPRNRTTDGSGESETSDQRKDRQLLSAVIVSILFIALTRTYSEHVAAHGCHSVPMGPPATRRLLLYFGAFLWSLNRMLITPPGGDVAVQQEQDQGGHVHGDTDDTVVTIWSALEWVRGSVVVVAALDMVYNFGIAHIIR